MQGPPAAGKSTLAKQIYNSDPSKYVIVSRDSIRESRGQYWIPDQESYISEIEEFEVRTALKHNLIPIIDATNLNPSTIDKWKKVAEDEDAEIDFKLVYVPFKTAIERDKQRDRQVTEKVIKRFYLKYFENDFRREVYTDSTYRMNQDKSLPKAVLVDLDCTIAFHTGRGPYEWDKIYTDVPDDRMVDTLKQLANSGVLIIFLTGRNKTEVAYKQTDEWLSKYCDFPWILIMRDAEDYRSTDICKQELYNKYIKDKYYVISVFDDSLKCIRMWRELGLMCCAVGENDY